MSYGEPPVHLGTWQPEATPEAMDYQYQPLKMPGMDQPILEPRIERLFGSLIGKVACDFIGVFGLSVYMRSWVYITAKHRYSQPKCPINRPGWHTDGFGTDDTNYIWSDDGSTMFLIGKMPPISEDHTVSMRQFNMLAIDRIPNSYGPNEVLRLSPHVIHRTGRSEGWRTFVKVSFSTRFYDLIGNTKNYLLVDCPPLTRPRMKTRNDP